MGGLGDEATLDCAAAGHLDRCQPAGRMGVSCGHAGSGKSSRWIAASKHAISTGCADGTLALRDVRLERGWNGRGTGASRRHPRFTRCVRPRAGIMRFHPSPIAARATKVPRCQCWASAPCNCRQIAIRSRRMSTRRTTEYDHADLPGLVAAGVLRNLPTGATRQPPRIVAASPIERAALGYLHAQLRPLPLATE